MKKAGGAVIAAAALVMYAGVAFDGGWGPVVSITGYVVQEDGADKHHYEQQ